MHYFINKETRELVIVNVYINNVCFMGSKDFLLLLELKQKFMIKYKCCNLRETKEFLEIYISHNHKDQKIFVDQFEYLNKTLACFNVATNLTSIPLPLCYVFKPNDKQWDPNFCQKYQQIVKSPIYLIIDSCHDIEFAVVKLV